MLWWKKKKSLADDLKAVTEAAGDQIAPGVGTLILVLGAAAVAGAGAYYVNQKRKAKRGQAGEPAQADKQANKKAARSEAASPKSDAKGA